MKERLGELIDRLNRGPLDPRLGWGLLFSAMAVSTVYCLWLARGTTFTGDELLWVGSSPGLDLKTALSPSSGHLVAVSFGVYKVVLETIGADYVTFRLLTLGALFLAVALLYAYGRRRVGDALALAPCLVLLFFGSDNLHILQGNGFTILFSIACGLLALLAIDRGGRAGDLLACAALVVGAMTYTVALAFLAGAIVAILLRPDRRRHLWVVAVPLALYLAWRVWVLTADIDLTRGGLDIQNIVLLPDWIFQSLSSILNALTGVNYNFNGAAWLPAGSMAGPVLALAFVVLIGWRAKEGKLGPGFWIAATVAVALFTSQVLTWIPAIREPGTPRYLYPGAFVVILVLFEAFRAFPFSRTAFISIWIVALAGFATNVMFLKDTGAGVRAHARLVTTDLATSSLIDSAQPFEPGPAARSLAGIVSEPTIPLVPEAQRRYGGIGLDSDALPAQAPDLRGRADQVLIQAYGIGLVPADGGPKGACETVRGGGIAGPTVVSGVPEGGISLESNVPATVSAKRFGDEFSNNVGSLNPNQAANLYIPADDGNTPWALSVDAPAVRVCEPE